MRCTDGLDNSMIMITFPFDIQAGGVKEAHGELSPI
jgi:hypothetical protein